MTKNNQNKRNILKGIALLAITFSTLTGLAQTAHVVIDAAKVINRIPAKMYGSCIEDVNHEIYGGLYDQRLYGESFEEPAPPARITGWKTLQGDWNVVDGGISVKSGPGYKLIKEGPGLIDGSIEADLKFGRGGENAGFIVRVNNEQAGMDDFDGYEISVAPGRQMMVLGKHLHNFKLLKEAKITFDRANWVHLKVVVKGRQIAIYLNNDNIPALAFSDNEKPLLTGKIGLRTFNADVVFKNVVIKQNSDVITNAFVSREPLQISSVWDGITSPSAGVKFALDTTGAYNSKQAQVINYINGTGKVGIANTGLNRWGIAIKQGQKFQGYVFLKGDITGPVTVALQNADGTKNYAVQQFANITSNWKKYPFALTANGTDTKARFAIYIDKKGKLEIDQAVLMGTGSAQFEGLPLRADIAMKMKQEGLNFVRYGGTMVNAPDYKWKNMIGPRDKRPMYEGHWYPYTSNGFGIEEFVAYCEAAGFDPAFAVNVEEKPEDIADMLEYLTGSVATPWGKKRAEYGHPKPYKLKYIELGNEEVIWGDLVNDYKHYAERFNVLYSVIHAKNPEIKVICAAWWRPKSEANMELVFKAVNGKAAYWDLHTDADEANAGKIVDHNLQFMHDQFLKWDPNTTLKCTIFEENGGLHNIQRALGHATTLNAVRRHGDFVLTSCAANGLQGLGQNDNGWDQGQVFFTPSQVWGMPPFYATQMAAKNHEPLRIFSSVEGDLDVTATRDKKSNRLVLHVVNTTSAAAKTTIDINGFDGRKPDIKVYTLSGDPKGENTPRNPEMIVTKEKTIQIISSTITYDFPANSYTILRFEKQGVK